MSISTVDYLDQTVDKVTHEKSKEMLCKLHVKTTSFRFLLVLYTDYGEIIQIHKNRKIKMKGDL